MEPGLDQYGFLLTKTEFYILPPPVDVSDHLPCLHNPTDPHPTHCNLRWSSMFMQDVYAAYFKMLSVSQTIQRQMVG
jgi:hypothetical protein